MKLFKILLSIVLLSACSTIESPIAVPSTVIPSIIAPSPLPHGSEEEMRFQGNTPCDATAQPLPQIPIDAECEQMIWSLVLYQDSQSGDPTTYQLNSAYGLSKPNTNDLIDGGTPIVIHGKWTITNGTQSNPDATIYQLNPDDPPNTVSFLKVGENLLHLLNRENEMLVGNGAWSYTLNRMDNQSLAPHADPDSVPDLPTRPPLPSMPEGSTVFGVFDGRAPCHELLFELLKTAPYAGCLKLKMRLTLYQQADSGAPSTYLILGTSTYREGTWAIYKDLPDRIYQLFLDDGQPPISLRWVDENHLFFMDRDMNLLVGNELFSFTLSRNASNP